MSNFKKFDLFLSLNIDFYLSILSYAAFHLGLHCSPKYQFTVFRMKRVKVLFTNIQGFFFFCSQGPNFGPIPNGIYVTFSPILKKKSQSSKKKTIFFF